MTNVVRITWLVFFWVNWLFAASSFAGNPISVTIDDASAGYLIPDDFAGIGFETYAELSDRNGVSGCLFSPTNAHLIALFTNTGIRNLRLGGGTVDGPHPAIPSPADIDNVFGFARAAGIKIIYTLPLLDSTASNAAAIASYIWQHYRDALDCFSIGNEPNEPPYRDAKSGAITNFTQFLNTWKTFAAAVTNAVPGAPFAGPEAGGWDWVPEFAQAEKNSGNVILITHHEYVGGKPFINHGREEMPSGKAIDNMLSPNWVTNKCPEFYAKTLAQVKFTGLAGRMTEANDYLRGVTNASDAFASALWALDYLHWWAERGLAGVNFHNNQWLKTDTFYLDKATGNFQIHPKAYGIRAFDLGGHGWTKTVNMINKYALNVTAYAVSDGKSFYVTIINKEHDRRAREAYVSLRLSHLLPQKADAMFLIAPNNNPGATNGITLGGAPIVNYKAWTGKWARLSLDRKGQCNFNVPSAAAVVVRLMAFNLLK